MPRALNVPDSVVGCRLEPTVASPVARLTCTEIYDHSAASPGTKIIARYLAPYLEEHDRAARSSS
jgi:hypothetical protein